MTLEEKINRVEEFKKLISPDIDNFIDYLPMLIASNEDDRRALMLAWDMIKGLKNDIKESETLSELNQILDVDAIVRDFPELKLTMSKTQQKIRSIRDSIEVEFGAYE